MTLPITFQIDQVQLRGEMSYGVPGVSRKDLYINTEVYLHAINVPPGATYYWEFLYQPVGSTADLRDPETNLTDRTCATPFFIPDVWGSYRLSLTVSVGGRTYQAILICAITFDAIGGLLNRGWRYPAFKERDVEANFEGNTIGSVPDINAILEDLRANIGGGGGNLTAYYLVGMVDETLPNGLLPTASTSIDVKPGEGTYQWEAIFGTAAGTVCEGDDDRLTGIATGGLAYGPMDAGSPVTIGSGQSIGPMVTDGGGARENVVGLLANTVAVEGAPANVKYTGISDPIHHTRWSLEKPMSADVGKKVYAVADNVLQMTLTKSVAPGAINQQIGTVWFADDTLASDTTTILLGAGPAGEPGADGGVGPQGPAGASSSSPVGLLVFSPFVDFGSASNSVCLARIRQDEWIVAVSTGIAKTTDAGVTWVTKASETTPVLAALSVAYLGFGRCLCFYHDAPGYRRISTDYGETWSARQLTTNASGAVQIHQLGGGRIVHSGLGAGYLSAIYSSDYGATWSDCAPVNSDASGNSSSNGGCYLGGGVIVVPWAADTTKSLRRSVDGGINWVQVPNGTPWLTRDLIDCGDGVLFCCTAQALQNNCSRSTDYGQTFVPLASELYDRKVNCGVYIGGGRLVLGCESGEIIESFDKGVTFTSRGVCSLGSFLRLYLFDGDLIGVHPLGVLSKCAGIR